MKIRRIFFTAALCIGLSVTISAQSKADNVLNVIENVINALATLPPATQEHSILNLYNNTDKGIYFAIAYYDRDNDGFCSKGWYYVEAYSERNLDFGGYIGKIYIHGYRTALWGLSEYHWGTGYSFCINHSNSFDIRNADKISCDKRGEFSEYSLSSGINKWTFNP